MQDIFEQSRKYMLGLVKWTVIQISKSWRGGVGLGLLLTKTTVRYSYSTGHDTDIKKEG